MPKTEIFEDEIFPPCARYEGGENDDRLWRVWAYVAGLLGGGANAKEVRKKIARLYDYKGTLVVALYGDLPPYIEATIRRAWAEIAYEVEENTEFVSVASSDWNTYWNSRRFDSDWEPRK